MLLTGAGPAGVWCYFWQEERPCTSKTNSLCKREVLPAPLPQSAEIRRWDKRPCWHHSHVTRGPRVWFHPHRAAARAPQHGSEAKPRDKAGAGRGGCRTGGCVGPPLPVRCGVDAGSTAQWQQGTAVTRPPLLVLSCTPELPCTINPV